MSNENHCLKNKIITAIELAQDKKAMRFIIKNNEPIVAKADGDCCSSTWIEHVQLPARGFPALVTEVEELEMPQIESKIKYAECLAIYGLKIATDKGDIIIDFRNESNGYYGGNLCWPGEHFYGGVYGQNVSEEIYELVTKDI